MVFVDNFLMHLIFIWDVCFYVFEGFAFIACALTLTLLLWWCIYLLLGSFCRACICATLVFSFFVSRASVSFVSWLFIVQLLIRSCVFGPCLHENKKRKINADIESPSTTKSLLGFWSSELNKFILSCAGLQPGQKFVCWAGLKRKCLFWAGQQQGQKFLS